MIVEGCVRSILGRIVIMDACCVNKINLFILGTMSSCFVPCC